MAIDIAGRGGPMRWRVWLDYARRGIAMLGGGAPGPTRDPRLWDRGRVRYVLALGAVAGATAATFVVGTLAEKPWAFPFYAAIVVSAWFGTGPGFFAVLLATAAVEYFWASPHYSLHVEANDLPWFLSFVICALVSLVWSTQRRRAQQGLEAIVQQRTADLRQTNAALQVEIAEREMAEAERRRTEQALRDAEVELARTLRLATLAELAAAIAHEINQPLAAITANGSACVRFLAQSPPMLDNAREAASCIVADGHRAADVIARIRALFNKEEPKQQLIDVNDVIRRVLELSRGAIDRQRVVTRRRLARSSLAVIGDPIQLQQVLVNLFTNALEAMASVPEGERALIVKSEKTDNAVVVTVEDTGPGLAPGEAVSIFDSFYTTKPDGIGVGLAISRSIIDAHGGSLWATPARPRGARIGFSLPPAQIADH